jgi:hypothetical protein
MAKNRPAAKLQSPVSQSPAHIRFSFQYYDAFDDKYCLSKGSPEQVREALVRLGEINRNTFSEMDQKKKFYNFHPILDWGETKEAGGFPYSELNSLTAFQFSLPKVNGGKARVFGAFSGETFYVVWFDLNHQIWPSYKKGT